MLTPAMERIVGIVARHHRCDERGVVLLAAAMGPAPWRGCVPTATYVFKPCKREHRIKRRTPIRRRKRDHHYYYDMDEEQSLI